MLHGIEVPEVYPAWFPFGLDRQFTGKRVMVKPALPGAPETGAVKAPEQAATRNVDKSEIKNVRIILGETMITEADFRAGLSVIRRRRWYVWMMILVYLPSTWLTLAMTQSFRSTGIVFAIWLLCLCTTITLFAVARCPQCGMNFHMRNAALSFARTCRHCGLPLKGARSPGTSSLKSVLDNAQTCGEQDKD